MHEAIARVVDPLLAAADAALGAGYSAVLYGSGARGDWVPGRSDINLLLVTEGLQPATLRALGPAFTAWRKHSPEPPLILTRDEWRAAADAFPIEITDMRAAYKVLRGADPLAEIQVAPADLRRALEREFRGKLLRLRQGYIMRAADPDGLGQLAAESVSTILLLCRALLTLLGRPAPAEPVALAEAAADTIGFPPEALTEIVRHRLERRRRCSTQQFEAYLAAAEIAARYVDHLQLGDPR
jgi:predicted nucleotidyltransferase